VPRWRTGVASLGGASPRVDAALDNLYAIYQGYTTRPAPTASLANAALPKVDQLVASRRARIDQSQTELPGLLRLLLIGGVVLFIVLSYPGSMEALHVRLLTVGGIAAFLSFAFTRGAYRSDNGAFVGKSDSIATGLSDERRRGFLEAPPVVAALAADAR
jgi:hypothetical protein